LILFQRNFQDRKSFWTLISNQRNLQYRKKLLNSTIFLRFLGKQTGVLRKIQKREVAGSYFGAWVQDVNSTKSSGGAAIVCVRHWHGAAATLELRIWQRNQIRINPTPIIGSFCSDESTPYYSCDNFSRRSERRRGFVKMNFIFL
jgi:hypothetical protein